MSSYANIIYCLNFVSILTDLPFNLNVVRARFEFDIWWPNVCVPSQILEFLNITFLVALRRKGINAQKNESERARKAFWCFNFLSILNLPINLNFVRARFEFDITWLNICVVKTLNFWLLHSWFFCIQKRINVQTIKASGHVKPFVWCHCCCRLHLWLLELQKHKGISFRLFQ